MAEERIKWVTHKGKKIIVVDYSGANELEAIATMKQLDEEIRKKKNERILLLVNITNFVMTKNFTDVAKENKKRIANEGIQYTECLVGFTGIKKNIAKMLDRKSYYADTIEEARDCLVNPG